MLRKGTLLRLLLVLLTFGLAIPGGGEAFAKKSKHGDVASRSKASRSSKTKHAAKRPKKDTVVLAKASQEQAQSATPAEPAPPPLRLLTRAEILASPADRLERIGRHLVIGYYAFADVKALVEARAIAGILITDHNVRGRTVQAIKAEIAALQDIRRQQGLPPLIVAADQEGGYVSRLSPPLKRQRSLSALLASIAHDEERKTIVETYAREQAAELSRVGVTMNFGPVVDLKLDPGNRDDGETRLRLRAIAADPFTVAKVAGWYCDELARANIMCTLKHFPGLGRVRRDTHVVSAEVSASEGTLELNDWVPFRRVMSRPHAVTMLGHVRIAAVDKTAPASYSQEVIGRLIRRTWEHDGLLITDDFSMGAITRGKPGIGRAAVQAFNAGVDLLLISFSEKHLDTVMSALLAADESGNLDVVQLANSRDRLERLLRANAAASPSP